MKNSNTSLIITIVLVAAVLLLALTNPKKDEHISEVKSLSSKSMNSKKQVLNNSESRLRAIYDRNEFRAKRLRANWLPDGSAYTVFELDNESQKQILVRYEMTNGNRTVIDSPLKEENLNLEKIHLFEA